MGDARSSGNDASAGTASFVHRIRVGWADCDPARIAYTGRIPYFALEAIDAWWQHRIGNDWFSLNIDRNLGTPFARLEMDFRFHVTPRAPLECTVHLTRLGETSIGFAVDGHQAGRLCFQGKFVCVFVVADRHEKTAIPADIRAIAEPFLSAPPA
ncbi:thioesterase family protein [Mesorhizobium sp. CAU 1732]|uniref:acyl-CoA thioesterase n=1 Tax=Mesorhizobium sp. CAU 1732 TaxID=3140358 RepID=UPI003261B678